MYSNDRVRLGCVVDSGSFMFHLDQFQQKKAEMLFVCASQSARVKDMFLGHLNLLSSRNIVENYIM